MPSAFPAGSLKLAEQGPAGGAVFISCLSLPQSTLWRSPPCSRGGRGSEGPSSLPQVPGRQGEPAQARPGIAHGTPAPRGSTGPECGGDPNAVPVHCGGTPASEPGRPSSRPCTSVVSVWATVLSNYFSLYFPASYFGFEVDIFNYDQEYQQKCQS